MAKCKGCVVGLFGVCRLEYCGAEHEGLIEEAQRSSERRGHTLAAFVKIRGYPIWQAPCVHCGGLVSINLDPSQGEPDVYGEVLDMDCPEASAERTRAGSDGDTP